MKQFISILLIVTVNILFLTHAILPHHHHEGIPHLTFSVTHHDHHAGETGCCCPEKKGSPCDASCALDGDIDVVVPTDEEDQHGPQICTLHHHDHQLLQALLLPLLYDFTLPTAQHRLRTAPPYLINYISDFQVRSLGLRAPPFC
ncbi:hypothetical protein LJB84_01230 [Bacteroidales bacterium OttesenSCG-928-J19]|nr:hypothetical protein [Bacteroidales bacterium OttesenSCG-928-J19]